MINTWWVTRPKRKLDSVPEVLSLLVEQTLDSQWVGKRETHLAVEEALEKSGLKRVGDRRDQQGGGARTYYAWLKSLGLVFQYQGQTKLTLAGEAILNGQSPVSILKNQVIKYQFPSSFSISRGVEVNPRFRIHPFWFLLKLLCDWRLGYYLSQSEIARVVIENADNESEECYERIVNYILEFRSNQRMLEVAEFHHEFASSRSILNEQFPFRMFEDTANTFVNWLEYTQLIYRESGCLFLIQEKKEEVLKIVANKLPFIERPEDEVFFQRKYGIDPDHAKDTRNLSSSITITASLIAQNKVRSSFIAESLKRPITRIDSKVIESIFQQTGISESFIEDTLQKLYPHGSANAFMTNYFQMAFKGKEEATEFEKATSELFSEVFGFKTEHVGPIGLTPDVLLISNECGLQGIIDNKAYAKYSISNDHHNRMVDNYIMGLSSYSSCKYPLKFFSYIAGGFVQNINSQIHSITEKTGISGSAITVSNIIYLVENHQSQNYSHDDICKLMSIGRQVLQGDILNGESV